MERTPALDQVRQLLFPDLSVEEGWGRMEDAFRAAEDRGRLDELDRRAANGLSEELAAIVRRLQEREETRPPD